MLRIGWLRQFCPPEAVTKLSAPSLSRGNPSTSLRILNLVATCGGQDWWGKSEHSPPVLWGSRVAGNTCPEQSERCDQWRFARKAQSSPSGRTSQQCVGETAKPLLECKAAPEHLTVVKCRIKNQELMFAENRGAIFRSWFILLNS